MKSIFKLYIFKLVVLSITMSFISFGANANKNKRLKDDCEALHDQITSNLSNYFLVFKYLKSTDTKEYYDSEIRRASDYLDKAHKQSNVYNAVCK